MAVVEPGEILLDKYRVERVLGEGGMGVVVAATNLTLGQTVALKFLLPEVLGGSETLERFQREARIASRLRSEHVAKVIDAGTLEDGSPYIVMEYLKGDDLGHVLRDKGPLAVSDAVDYLLQACEAVAEAHSQGIVHRDLKPSNLFLTTSVDGRPMVKVLDFGICKVRSSDEDASITSTAALVGSPSYMSPEQIRSAKHVDARTDIWSLGVTLYELLTGRLPFAAAGPSATIAKIVADAPEPLRTARPEVPAELEAVVSRCLAKNPADRFRSVGSFSRALRTFGSDASKISVERISSVMKPEDDPARGMDLEGELADKPEAKTAASWANTRTGSKARPGILIGAGIAGAVALTAVAFLALRQPASPLGPPRDPASLPAVSASVAASANAIATASVPPATGPEPSVVEPPAASARPDAGPAPVRSAAQPAVKPPKTAPTQPQSTSTAPTHVIDRDKAEFGK